MSAESELLESNTTHRGNLRHTQPAFPRSRTLQAEVATLITGGPETFGFDLRTADSALALFDFDAASVCAHNTG